MHAGVFERVTAVQSQSEIRDTRQAKLASCSWVVDRDVRDFPAGRKIADGWLETRQ